MINAVPVVPRDDLVTADHAFRYLPNAVLILNHDNVVECANDAALSLFMTLDPVGSTLKSLFTLNGMVGGSEMIAAVSAGTSVSTRLTDGRVFDFSSRPLPDGKVAVSLFDVSRYVHDAERATRDALTGLLNRTSFHELLREKLAQAQRSRAVSGRCESKRDSHGRADLIQGAGWMEAGMDGQAIIDGPAIASAGCG